MFALISNESLKRSLIGGLGATLFGLTCLLAATGPAAINVNPTILSQTADTPQSRAV